MTSLARATAVMSFGTVLSRVTGLLRLAAIAAAIGAAETRLADTYHLANTAPNIIYELILGGILTSVFVPVFVELLEKEGKEKAWEVASAIINLSMVVLAGLATVLILAAPWIASFYSVRLEGAEAELQRDVLTFLLRLFIPQIIFYALAAITAGLLNAHRRFGPPMYTPILNNIAVIIVFIFFARSYGTLGLDEVSTGQKVLLGLGTTGGVALMALAQLPFLRGLGRYKLTMSIKHPSVKKLARLSVFVIGYVITNQLGYLLVQWLANDQQGGYSAYVYAFTFFMLPHGLFAVSVITALLPGMSEHAVNERWDEFRERLSLGIRATLLLVLPAAVGFFVLGEDIVRFLLERGVMTGASTDLVAGVLKLFVIGLVPFSLFQLFLRAYYAIHDTKTPFLINCGAVAVNAAVNVPMFYALGVKGLAAGHAVSYVFGVTVQARLLSRRIGGLHSSRIVRSGAKIAAAGAGMGFTVWGIDSLIGRTSTVLVQTSALALEVAAGVAVYVALAVLFKVEELALIRGLMAKRRVGDIGDR